jgi:hypothetical protein
MPACAAAAAIPKTSMAAADTVVSTPRRVELLVIVVFLPVYAGPRMAAPVSTGRISGGRRTILRVPAKTTNSWPCREDGCVP